MHIFRKICVIQTDILTGRHKEEREQQHQQQQQNEEKKERTFRSAARQTCFTEEDNNPLLDCFHQLSPVYKCMTTIRLLVLKKKRYVDR